MKRYLLAGAVAALTFGGFVAVATTLGGITSHDLGADKQVLLACDTDGVTTEYTIAYDAAQARNEVTATAVGGVHADCVGQTVTVTLTDASDVVLDTSSATAASPTTSVTATAPPAAFDVKNVHVVITG